jgi:N-acetyl sugar amidotransferase
MTDFEFPKIDFTFDKELTLEPKDTIKKYNLPKEVVFCKRCAMSNQRPRIRIDHEGICSACRFDEQKDKKIDWKKREKHFLELCDRHRSKDGSWDVVVPCSGGKDSARVAHMLKYKYHMHPLTVTWAPHVYTEVGWENLQRFIHTGFDNILGHPDGIVHRKLTRLAFEVLGDAFQPFIYGAKAFPLRIATKFQIPLIMYGENGEVEYGGAQKNEESPTHNYEDDLVKHYYSGAGPDYWKQYGFTDDDLKFYHPPKIQDMKDVGIECHFFGFYHKWIPQENYYYAAENTGFKANPDGRSEGTYSKYASLDDQTDGYHYYLSFIKFGIGRATSDSSHEVRDDHITREEAIALIKKFDGEFPKKYFHTFLSYTGMSEERFWQVVDTWRSPHIWKNVNGQWRLRKAIYDETGTSDEIPVYISSLPEGSRFLIKKISLHEHA